jgi:hypothetical protein
MGVDQCAQIGLLERIHGFVVAGESNDLIDDRWADFEQLLWDSDDACRLYAEYMGISALLPTIVDAMPGTESSSNTISLQEDGPVAPLVSTHVGSLLPSALGYSAWTISYLSSAVITGLLILGFWLMPASRPEQVARNAEPIVEPSVAEPKAYVGKVTGTVDCKIGDSRVSLGQKIDLPSGLMEITYNTGAKVILQGPVTYSVEANGGYLAVGKLTGKLEKGSAGRGTGGESSIQHSAFSIHHSPNAGIPQSPIPNPFVIHTPTATVTDLGTEFGVEVTSEGQTRSYVFVGQVQVQPTADRKPFGQSIVLRRDESVIVEHHGDKPVLHRATVSPTIFVRVGQMARLNAASHGTLPDQWRANNQALRADPSLVVYYTFAKSDRGLSVASNESPLGSAMDGKLKNVEWVSGRVPGKPALFFHGPDSDSSVLIPYHPLLSCNGPFSVAVCFRTAGSFASYWQGLLAQGRDSWRLTRNNGQRALTFDTDRYEAGPNGPRTSIVTGQTLGNTPVDDGQWHWAVAVFEPLNKLVAAKRIYIDGQLDAENQQALARHCNKEPISLGGGIDSKMVAFHGTIDEVAIFSRALSAQDVARWFSVNCTRLAPTR